MRRGKKKEKKKMVMVGSMEVCVLVSWTDWNGMSGSWLLAMRVFRFNRPRDPAMGPVGVYGEAV